MLGKTFTLFLLGALSAAVSPSIGIETVDVIPAPQQAKLGGGSFTITAGTRVLVEPHAPAAAEAAKALMDRLSTGAGLALTSADGEVASPGAILLTTHEADGSLGDEGYKLEVTTDGVTIRAPHAAGLYYGVQTLLQLMPPAIYRSSAEGAAKINWSVPTVQITDMPRFHWRGMLLDVARHFEPKAQVLRLLDQMAIHKLNVLHWHLTDDQGWRLEIKQYPKLTSIAAWRKEAGFGLNPALSTTYGPDGRYGGFYTQDDVREVLAYAAARHILVMPEIEMPGHASAALRAYPEFFVPAPPSKETKGDAGIFNGIYEPANEQTFVFLQNVLTEVIDLFPSPYIHIGGDEVPKGPWQANPPDVAFMAREHLATTDQLQSYFVSRIGKFIASKGRKMAGWDEILEGGLAPDATVMSWRGTEGGLAAAHAGHDVIMTPAGFCYLDGEQGSGAEPHERGTVLPVQKVYSYEPIPATLAPELTHHILGLQGNLWTEYVPNMPWAEYMIWPREAAVSEVGWTPAAGRDWNDFAQRLGTEEKRLDAMGVNYRPLVDDNLMHAIHLSEKNPGQLVIENPLPDTKVHYSIDASYPTGDSPIYAQPIALPSGWVQIAARFFKPGTTATAAASATFLDGRAVKVTSTMPKDWDARQTCFFTPVWGGGADDSITISFTDGPQSLHGVTIKSGTAENSDTRLKSGLLEGSADGKAFTQIAVFGADGSAIAALDGKPLTAIRIRITAMQMPHPVIQSVALQ